MSNDGGIDLGGEGGRSFQFRNPGDEVTGDIISIDPELDQTDLTTGQVKKFDDGSPMKMTRVNLQTDFRNGEGLKDYDPAMIDDDGVRSVYLKGSKKPESKSTLAAALGAVRIATRTQAGRMLPGGRLTLRMDGEDGPVGKRRKLYSSKYVVPPADYTPPAPAADQGSPWAGAASPTAAPPF